MSEQSPMLRVGSPLGTGYAVARFLGVGSLGRVYEVRNAEGERFIAKTMPIEPGEPGREALASLQSDVRRLAGLDARRVVRIVDTGIDEVQHLQFIVTPFLSGCTLENLVEKLGPLHPTAAVRLVTQACESLAEAHRARLVHGNLNPSNVFLEYRPSGEVLVRLCDFGLRRWERWQRSLAKTGSLPPAAPVSLLFRAPEHAVTKEQDTGADVWAAAMVLYFALCANPTRRQPCSIDDSQDFAGIGHLQDLAPWIPRSLAEIVHGGLILDRSKRCPSIEAWMGAIAPFAAGGRELTASSISPVPPEMSRMIAERAVPPAAWGARRLGPGADAGALPRLDVDPLMGMLVGGYLVVRIIGRGGMGAVYEAMGADGRRVALKVLQENAAMKPGALVRMLREAKTVTKISSPYVVQILDAGTDAEAQRPYLVMELLRGSDLEKYVLRSGALEPGPVARIFQQICEGLAAVHAMHVIHRDVKPSNIFIHETEDGVLIPKLFDFGVAKQVATVTSGAASLTRTGHLMGSPLYMSPEHVQDARGIDARSDIWSVGIALYEALTGVNPWDRHVTVGELLLAVCTLPAPPLREHAPWVDPGLAAVVHRCLERDRSARFQSATELAEALAPFASEEQLVANALGAISTEKLANSGSVVLEQALVDRRALRRRRGWLAAAALVAVGGMTAALLWSQRQAASEPAHTPASATPSALTPHLATSAPSTKARLRIEAVPATAVLYLDGAVLPSNPHEQWWVADGAEHAVRAEAPGYVAVEKRIRARADVNVEIALKTGPVGGRSPASEQSLPTPAAGPASNCDPPFFLDERGAKTFKPGCI